MGDAGNAPAWLAELARPPESAIPLEESLEHLAATAAGILNARRASIMLLDEREETEVRLRVYAAYGGLPEAAFRQLTRAGEGIAGRVLETRQALLVEDIRRSEFVHVARRLNEGSTSLISAPILIDGRIVGVVNVSDPRTARPFNLNDLHLLEVTALFIGKSIQVAQLQGLLKSRFAQMALTREAQNTISGSAAMLGDNPNRLAKILARSFFREMVRAGFSASQIIHAASEIITQLNEHLGRLKRLQKKRGLS